MIKLLTLNFKLLTLLNRAYQSLRDWFDPAMEGNPYQTKMGYKLSKRDKTNKLNWFYWSRRYGLQKS